MTRTRHRTRVVTGHHLARLVTMAVAAVLFVARPASAATHLSGNFEFPGSLCGFAGTYQVQFIDNFGSTADGSSWDAGQIHEAFTANNGRGVTIDFADGRVVNLPAVVNADGTMTLVSVYSGSQFKIQAINGPVLQQNTGRLRVTAVVAPDGSLLSFSVEVLAGPNPNTSGDENSPDSCSVIGPYLAGG
jgi:hypothetical protein